MKIKLIILLQQMTAKEINPFDWMRETKKSLKKVLTKNFECGENSSGRSPRMRSTNRKV